jgi:hypothetical protein
LLIHYNDFSSLNIPSVECFFKTAQTSLQSAVDSIQSSDTDVSDKQLSFLAEQLQLSGTTKKRRRYTNCLLCFAYILYIKSPACYIFIRKSNLLSLLHPNTLRNLTSPLSMSTETVSYTQYLKLKASKLNDLDRIVAVQMDEIHVKSAITYYGGQLLGHAAN